MTKAATKGLLWKTGVLKILGKYLKKSVKLFGF